MNIKFNNKMLFDKGVVIGKFYPLHKGHEYLIEIAKSKVKHLYIIICGKYEEEPNPLLREIWIKNIYNDKNITVHRIVDLYDPNDSELWAKITKGVIGCCPDIVFTSEKYGEKYANFLNCTHVLVDINRTNNPISGTIIRNNPFKNWDYLNPLVRQYYTIRIVFVGAESTGKTTMSSKLAEELKLFWVPEYAREYCESFNILTKVWDKEDFEIISSKQNEIENIAAQHNKIIICDTDSCTTSIWYERYLHQEINYKNIYEPTLYFLSDFNGTEIIDDGTRIDCNDEIRLWMHNKILQKIIKSGNKYVILSGSYEQRYEKAKSIVNEYIKIINEKENCEIIEIKNERKLFNTYEYIFIFVFCIISIIFSFIDITPGNPLLLIDVNENITWQKILFLLSGIASFTGALSVILASKEYIYTYIFGIISCITFGLYTFAYGYIGNFQLNIMYFLPLQFDGLYVWNSDIKVRSLNKLQIIAYTYLCFVLWFIFYFEISSFTKYVTKQEYIYEENILARVLDSGTTSLSIIAQYLLINKYYESWIIWIIVDIFQIIMFSGINNFISVNIIIMTCIYLINAFYGLYLWKHKKNY
jgi:HTH-type transcriptional repressor of NAD biosynthesis genes